MPTSNVTVTVSKTSASGKKSSLKNAPIILFNKKMVMRTVDFTRENGKCIFLNVESGQYFIMVIDPTVGRYRVISQQVAGVDPDVRVLFPAPGDDKGRIIATVQVGGANVVGKPVNLYVAGTSVPIATQLTDLHGRVEFINLDGVYDVEAIAGHKTAGCRKKATNLDVPGDENVIVPALIQLDAACGN